MKYVNLDFELPDILAAITALQMAAERLPPENAEMILISNALKRVIDGTMNQIVSQCTDNEIKEAFRINRKHFNIPA